MDNLIVLITAASVAGIMIGLGIAILIYTIKITGLFKVLGEIMFTKALNYAKREDMHTADPRRARLRAAGQERIRKETENASS